MNPTAQMYDFATQILASKEFFERSTRVLEENDSEFRPRDEMMTVAQQVAHTAQTLEWFLNGATQPEGFDLNFEEQAKALAGLTSLAMAHKRLGAAFTRAVDFLRSRHAGRSRPSAPAWSGHGRSTGQRYRVGNGGTHRASPRRTLCLCAAAREGADDAIRRLDRFGPRLRSRSMPATRR